jgi:hypothetical protein
MGVRKNQNKLSDAEKTRFVAAVKKMKADAGAAHNYDKFVTIHAAAFSGGPNVNPAHMGPAFFPWHRYFLLKFENDLKAADTALGGDGSLTLPYWDWTHDNADGPNNQRGSLWKDDLLGGFGNPVSSGQFRSGQWTLAGGGSLVRALGRTGIDPSASPSLPEKTHVDTGLALEGFDTSPWDTSPAQGPAVASPPPPMLVGAAGGGLAPGIYRVSITYVNALGETRPSPEATICLGGACAPANANNAIHVASPPVQPSTTGFKVYVTAANGAPLSGTLQGAIRPLGPVVNITAVAAGAPLPTINTTGSMRNFIEGWLTTRGEPELHNRVHMFVAGSMAPGTSPNDPVFFLHHCNVDRLWALWQFRHPGQNYPLVVPQVGAPGNRPHGLNDPMPPWTTPAELKRPIDVLNHVALGYTYDSDPPGAGINVSP